MNDQYPSNSPPQSDILSFSNIDRTPFSDGEACEILKLTDAAYLREIQFGFINKSVAIRYRQDIYFHFVGLFDLYEYALRRNLFFLNHGNRPEVNELVCSLVDEMAFTIDRLQSRAADGAIESMKSVEMCLIALCDEDIDEWRHYWLQNGDRFESEKCATIAVKTWCGVLNSAMGILGPTVDQIRVPSWGSNEPKDTLHYVGQDSEYALQ